MRTALFTAVALSLLGASHALAQPAATPQPGAEAPSVGGKDGCPCCQKMAMMKTPEHGTMPGMQGTPSAPPLPPGDTPRR